MPPLHSYPIGHPDDEMVAPGASGSLNAKFRTMTDLTQQLVDKPSATISGSGLTIMSSFPTPIGVSGSVDNPVLTDVWDAINHLLRISGTVSVNPHNVGQTAGPWAVSGSVSNPVLDDVWDAINHRLRTSTSPVPQPLAVSGSLNRATSPKVVYGNLPDLAAGASGEVFSSPITSGMVGYLLKATVAASLPFKAELQTVSGGVIGINHAVWIEALGSWEWVAPARNMVIQAAGASFTGFRLVITNLDLALTTDFYACFYYDEDQ